MQWILIYSVTKIVIMTLVPTRFGQYFRNRPNFLSLPVKSTYIIKSKSSRKLLYLFKNGILLELQIIKKMGIVKKIRDWVHGKNLISLWMKMVTFICLKNGVNFASKNVAKSFF